MLMEPKGIGRVKPLRELRRIPLLGTWVNKVEGRQGSQPTRQPCLRSRTPVRRPLGGRLPVGRRVEKLGGRGGKPRRVGAVGTHLPDVAPSLRICPPIA